MKLQPWIASALIALGVSSCGENSPPPTQKQAYGNPNYKFQPTDQFFPAKDGSPSKRTVNDDMPVPPKDAQWTILCDTVEGPGHVENARDFKAILQRKTGMPDWYVIHTDKDSTIYYGFYRSLDNPAEKKRAEQDRLRIVTLMNQAGDRVLRGGVLVAINSPDPAAPPEWNLLNAPKTAYWSIEVASFAGNPKRKEAAVQAVRELREKGETEAYYYHGPTASSVCIGAWPREAVREQGTGIDKQGNMRDDAHAINADQPLLVFVGDVAPPNLSPHVLEPGTGKPMTVEGLKLDIQDADMKKKVADYPHHYINYELRGTQNGGQVFPDPSFLFIIPHEQSSAGDDDYLLSGGSPRNMGAQQPAPRVPGTPGDSSLRSIGDR